MMTRGKKPILFSILALFGTWFCYTVGFSNLDDTGPSPEWYLNVLKNRLASCPSFKVKVKSLNPERVLIEDRKMQPDYFVGELIEVDFRDIQNQRLTMLTFDSRDELEAEWSGGVDFSSHTHRILIFNPSYTARIDSREGRLIYSGRWKSEEKKHRELFAMHLGPFWFLGA